MYEDLTDAEFAAMQAAEIAAEDAWKTATEWDPEEAAS